MSRQQIIDAKYGRRGGGWAEGEMPNRVHPRCEVCGMPMVAGQRNRHGVCSPKMECCDAFSDLVPDVSKHMKQHAEAK